MKKQAYEKLMGLSKKAWQKLDYGPQPNTINSVLQDIVEGASVPVNAAVRFGKSVVNPLGTAVQDAKQAYNRFKNRGNSKPVGGAPMNKPSWQERLWARIFDPHEYVKQDVYYNPAREEKFFKGFDPHPSSTSGVNYSKVDSLRDYLRKSIKGGLNPAAADQLQLGKMFGPKDKGLHKVVGGPKTAIKSYIDTARVAHKGELARQMLAIRNSRKNKPGMWDILFNRWKWDE